MMHNIAATLNKANDEQKKCTMQSETETDRGNERDRDRERKKKKQKS